MPLNVEAPPSRRQSKPASDCSETHPRPRTNRKLFVYSELVWCRSFLAFHPPIIYPALDELGEKYVGHGKHIKRVLSCRSLVFFFSRPELLLMHWKIGNHILCSTNAALLVVPVMNGNIKSLLIEDLRPQTAAIISVVINISQLAPSDHSLLFFSPPQIRYYHLHKGNIR